MVCNRDMYISYVNVLELIIAIVIAGLIANTTCFDCFDNFHKDQFINGVVYGFMVICALLVLELIFINLYSNCWHFIIAVCGAILFFVVAILLLDYAASFPDYASRSIFLRLIFAGIFSFLMCSLFVINALLFLVRDECCDPCYPAECF